MTADLQALVGRAELPQAVRLSQRRGAGLQRLLLLHHLLVRDKVPVSGRTKTSVTFFDSNYLLDSTIEPLYVSFGGGYFVVVWSEAVRFQKCNVARIECTELSADLDVRAIYAWVRGCVAHALILRVLVR